MSALWTSDDELFQLARRELFPAVVGDVMDRMGLLHQFLPPAIQAIAPTMVTIGRAMTVLGADVYEEVGGSGANPIMARPFGLMLDALDNLQPNEVYVVTGGSPTYSVWGELMATRAQKCGAVGAVMSGYHRDTDGILAIDFPTFSIGAYAQDSGNRGKVIDYRVPVEIGPAHINPGDIIFGDRDGVCVIPRAAEEAVMRAALEKVRGEKLVHEAILNGMSASEAFVKYGVM